MVAGLERSLSGQAHGRPSTEPTRAHRGGIVGRWAWAAGDQAPCATLHPPWPPLPALLCAS